MRGAIIYFSGAGNTEYAATLFKRAFQNNNMECVLINTSKKKNFDAGMYDFFIFGAPIYKGLFPHIYVDWVRENIHNGEGRKCIVFSTQTDEDIAGLLLFSELIKSKGLIIEVQDYIKMSNSYYVVDNHSEGNEIIESLKEDACNKVKKLSDGFLKGEKHLKDKNMTGINPELDAYSLFQKWSLKWAKEELTVDNNLCVGCGKCVKNCPTRNIKLKDGITFESNCISCQKCLHICPVNAFMYRGEHFRQYRL